MNRKVTCVAAQDMNELARAKEEQDPAENIRMVNTKTLQKMLGCCYATAVRIGTEAGARFQIGSIVRWKVSRINEYLESTCTGGDKE